MEQDGPLIKTGIFERQFMKGEYNDRPHALAHLFDALHKTPVAREEKSRSPLADAGRVHTSLGNLERDNYFLVALHVHPP